MVMNETKVTGFTEGTLTHVPLSHILRNDEIKYRPLDEKHVAELAKNILENGLESPLLVWNGGTKKGELIQVEGSDKKIPATYLIAGNHRLAALTKIRRDDKALYKERFPEGIPVHVRSGEIQDVLLAQLRENVTRKDMGAEHILPIIKRLRKDFSMKGRAIAAAIGKHESYVSQILDAEETLGEQEAEEIANEGGTIGDLRKAAKKVKEAVKKGKDKKVAAKEATKEAKSKIANKKASGRQRDERRVSAKKVYERYIALPRGLKMGKKVTILETTLAYLAGDEDTPALPKELREDVESKSDDGGDEDDSE